jgi:hypothetical protein
MIDKPVPARQHSDPPMYPGGMSIDEEEEQAVLEVLRTRRKWKRWKRNSLPPSVHPMPWR